jgi:hypothetical protein
MGHMRQTRPCIPLFGTEGKDNEDSYKGNRMQRSCALNFQQIRVNPVHPDADPDPDAIGLLVFMVRLDTSGQPN